MRRPIRDDRLIVALLGVLNLAGCTQAVPVAVAPARSVSAEGVEFGTIASLRPVTAPTGPPAASIFAAIGMPAAAGQAVTPDDMEFVIRADDGRTLSVIQPNDQHFRPGERIALSRGPRTRIGRPAASPGS